MSNIKKVIDCYKREAAGDTVTLKVTITFDLKIDNADEVADPSLQHLPEVANNLEEALRDNYSTLGGDAFGFYTESGKTVPATVNTRSLTVKVR